MRAIVQRSLESRVSVDGEIIGSITKGMVLLVGFTSGDDEKTIDYMVRKIVNLRIFDDDNGVMNKSLLDIKGEILSISQFTLYADTLKGNRPSYNKALEASLAKGLYDKFNEKLMEYVSVSTGEFGAEMIVDICNDGPVTIILESRENDGK